MYIYFAYNLCIHSEIYFPELENNIQLISATKQNADIIICRRQIYQEEIEVSEGGKCWSGFLEEHHNVSFLVKLGRQIVVQAPLDINEAWLRPLILGPIFALLLRQRGLLVLHASCVAINGMAVAFLGHSGYGKSTLANAFYQQGYRLLTDDVMALKVDDDKPIVFPAYPHVRLLPDAATSLGYEFKELGLIFDGSPKRNNLLKKQFSQQPLPLKHIFILEKIAHTRNQVKSIPAQQAFVEIIRHSRVTNLLQNTDFVSSHLHQCTQLASKVKISLLQRRLVLNEINDIVKVVEQEVVDHQSQLCN